MKYLYVPHIWWLIASSATSLALGIYVLTKRYSSKGAKSFILSMFVVTIWSAGNALEMSAVDFGTKLFWANIQYIAYCFSPVTLLLLCMEFTGFDSWVKNRRIIWIAAVPAIILLLVWTDGFHGLVRYDMHMDYSGDFPVIAKKYGPAFYVHAVYSHMLNIVAWIMIARAVFFKVTVYRNQALALFFGISLIVVPNLLYISGLSPIKRFDITPVFFGPAGCIITWGIFRFKLFNLVPLARETVIETMDAGVLVLDLQDRIVDINNAFEQLIGIEASKLVTRSAEQVFVMYPDLLNACMDRSISHAEFNISSKEQVRTYEVFLSPLTDKKGSLIGRLAVIYDITESKRVRQELIKNQRKLAAVEERERMARDLHDNLGQVLGFLNLQAQAIRMELQKEGAAASLNKLDRLIAVTQDANSEMRQFIRNVRNSSMGEIDFIAELKKDISHYEKNADIFIRMDIPGGFDAFKLDLEVQLSVLNIIKEALNNVRKHAEAENVKISLMLEDEELSVVIEDDGKGFDVDRCICSGNNSFGLSIMRERTAEVGGFFDIDSAIGAGSRIKIRVPLMKGANNGNEYYAGR